MSHATPVGLTGELYEYSVPYTLALAERAGLALNYFMGMTELDLDHEMYFHAQFDQSSPSVLTTHVTSLGACQAKALEAIAFLRRKTGSTKGVEQEARMVEMMSGMLGDDGLLWVDGAPGKPSPGSPLYSGRKVLYATTGAPMKKVSRYASPITLTW